MFEKLISNPFGVALILLHFGAGVWSLMKREFYLTVYYFSGAALNAAVILK